jgi:glutamyl-tRNA reductase
MQQAMRKLGTLTPEQQAAVEQLTRSLMNKFLHEPTVRMREAASNGRGLGIVDAVRYLFALDEPKGAAGERSRESHSPSTGEH